MKIKKINSFHFCIPFVFSSLLNLIKDFVSTQIGGKPAVPFDGLWCVSLYLCQIAGADNWLAGWWCGGEKGEYWGFLVPPGT